MEQYIKNEALELIITIIQLFTCPNIYWEQVVNWIIGINKFLASFF